MLTPQSLVRRTFSRIGVETKKSEAGQEYNADGVYVGYDPVTFLEREMFIPETGEPIELHPEQRAVLREMFRRDENGFVYENILYSSIKKSAKTTIGAGIALWQAFRVPYGEIYIIGNDLRQADSRMAKAIRFTIEKNPRMMGIKLPTSTYRINLPNGTVIDTIPVDPAGEAGMNPTGLFYTEAWGMKHRKHELMWTEAQLSPTRRGESFSFMESYAGHVGESIILEHQYETIVKGGELLPEVAPELYWNGRAIAYWNTRAYLPWQTQEYYHDQEARLLPVEFRRIHKNEWGTSEDAFIAPEWWSACAGDVIFDERTPQIMGVDAGVSSDCFAIVTATKYIDRKEDGTEVTRFTLNHVRLFTAPPGGTVDFEEAEKYIREYCETYNVLEVCYDPYQLHSMMQKFRRERVIRVREFGQGGDRLIADSDFRTLIQNRDVVHPNNPDLNTHVLNANAKTDGNDSKIRMVKRSAKLKIDAGVAASMALARANKVNMRG